jgi:chitinase
LTRIRLALALTIAAPLAIVLSASSVAITPNHAEIELGQVTVPKLPPPPPGEPSLWVSGFYVGWMASTYPPSAIDFSSLTHVMVFSVLPHTNGSLDTTLFIDPTNGPLLAKDIAARAHAAGRKAILVVGGTDSETGFSGATRTASMSTFVQNLVGLVTTWGFDGLDIDWEPLATSDYSAMLALMNNLRAAMPNIILTADVGWRNANFSMSSTDASFYRSLGNAVDQMNMMTYAMADNWGGWLSWHSSAVTGAASNHPSSIQVSAGQYRAAGVPPGRIGVGIGFYGSCWNAPVTAPLQSPGSAHVVASDNTMSFANIMRSYYGANFYNYDAVAEAPYLSFSTPTGPSGCTFVSYEDERSVAAKAAYVKLNGLGGAMIWQLNEGYNAGASDPNALLHAIRNAFLISVLRNNPLWENRATQRQDATNSLVVNQRAGRNVGSTVPVRGVQVPAAGLVSDALDEPTRSGQLTEQSLR